MKGSRYFCLFIFAVILGLVLCSQKKERINNARRFINELNYERAIMEILNYRNENDAEVSYLLGYCYLKKNEYEEAGRYFEKSLQISSLFKDSIIAVYISMAKKFLKISDLNRALVLYQELVRLIPDYKEADNLFLIGDLNFEQGNFPAAIAAYRKGFEIDTASAIAKKAMKNYIKALIECDSLRLALTLAEEEYKKSKTAENIIRLGEIKYLLGLKLFNSGFPDSARNLLSAVISLQEPKSLIDDAYFYMGEIFYSLDSLDQAIDAYKRVIRLNPYQKGELVKKAQERLREIRERK